MHITTSAYIDDDERGLHHGYAERLEDLVPHLDHSHAVIHLEQAESPARFPRQGFVGRCPVAGRSAPAGPLEERRPSAACRISGLRYNQASQT